MSNTSSAPTTESDTCGAVARPRATPWASTRVRTGRSSTPDTHAAWAAISGCNRQGTPRSRATRAAASAPFVGSTAPSIASSPAATIGGTAAFRSRAPNTASAMGRSKADPRLGSAAGPRWTTIVCEAFVPAWARADLTRCFASRTEASGNPARLNPSFEPPARASTETSLGSTPTRTAELTFEIMRRTYEVSVTETRALKGGRSGWASLGFDP